MVPNFFILTIYNPNTIAVGGKKIRMIIINKNNNKNDNNNNDDKNNVKKWYLLLYTKLGTIIFNNFRFFGLLIFFILIFS